MQTARSNDLLQSADNAEARRSQHSPQQSAVEPQAQGCGLRVKLRSRQDRLGAQAGVEGRKGVVSDRMTGKEANC